MLKKFIPLILVLLISLIIVVLGFKLFTPQTINNNNFSTIPLKITNSNHKQIDLLVEIADTPEERSRGLMFRKNLDPNNGMLFIFEEPSILNFYMKNTYIPLDIIFINSEYKVVQINENVPPLQEFPLITSNQLSLYALEIAGGSSKSLDIQVGDQVNFQYKL